VLLMSNIHVLLNEERKGALSVSVVCIHLGRNMVRGDRLNEVPDDKLSNQDGPKNIECFKFAQVYCAESRL